SQAQKEKVDNHQDRTERKHIDLRFPEIFATEVFLHHVLIKTSHHNGDEHPTEKLLEKIIFHTPILEKEHFGIGTLINSCEHFTKGKIELHSYVVNGDPHCR